jgi:hypothetical protein
VWLDVPVTLTSTDEECPKHNKDTRHQHTKDDFDMNYIYSDSFARHPKRNNQRKNIYKIPLLFKWAGAKVASPKATR